MKSASPHKHRFADYLRPKASMFDTNAPLLQFGELATFNCDVGIVDGEWLAADPSFSNGNQDGLFDEGVLL